MKLNTYQRVHFIGIGGCGMSALATILISQGYTVSGSDLRETPTTIRLRDLGAVVHIGHESKHMRLVDVVIVSTAIPSSNPEIEVAISDNIPIYKRAELLGYLMEGFVNRVCIVGTHGKTTTTGLLTQVLLSADKDPTFMIGGEFVNRPGGGYLGRGDTFVAEADESDGTFLCLPASVGILLNLEPEHMDFYGSEKKLKDSFQQFTDQIVNANGYLIVNGDDEALMSLIPSKPEDVLTFGLSDQCDFWATNIVSNEEGISFDVMHDSDCLTHVSLSVYGQHNVYNALAVFTYCYRESIPLSSICSGLVDFVGTKRRFQLIDSVHGVDIFDDYAHHPTEIQSTLEGVKLARDNRVIAIFQPHRYTRTRDFMDGFSECFDSADLIVITDIYAANEEFIEGVHSEIIADSLQKRGVTVEYIPKKSEIPPFLLKNLMPNDLVLTMGAGDIHTVAKEISVQLKALVRLNLKEMSH